MGSLLFGFEGFFFLFFFFLSFSFSIFFGGRFMHRDKLMISSRIKSTIFVFYSKMAG